MIFLFCFELPLPYKQANKAIDLLNFPPSKHHQPTNQPTNQPTKNRNEAAKVLQTLQRTRWRPCYEPCNLGPMAVARPSLRGHMLRSVYCWPPRMCPHGNGGLKEEVWDWVCLLGWVVGWVEWMNGTWMDGSDWNKADGSLMDSADSWKSCLGMERRFVESFKWVNRHRCDHERLGHGGGSRPWLCRCQIGAWAAHCCGIFQTGLVTPQRFASSWSSSWIRFWVKIKLSKLLGLLDCLFGFSWFLLL